MDFAFPFDNPFTLQLSDQRSVLINTKHAFPFLKLTLQAKHNGFPNAWDGIKMRNNKSDGHNPKPFLRSRQTEAGHSFGKDHCACRTACIDRALFPGALS